MMRHSQLLVEDEKHSRQNRRTRESINILGREKIIAKMS